MIVGTAGHIDHGKTTLLKALTGIDTDRLEEEKRRGISIDIGFAHMELGSSHVGFIDVPGHEKFVKNMLAGIGGIHLVLLVVAADESVMPQTVEHFQICKLLEIPRGIIAITKKNLVEEELLSLVEAEVRELVEGSPLEQAPIVAVDSVSGEGVELLKETLGEEIEKSEHAMLAVQNSHRVFRLPIDRVFTIRGFGTVITGTPYTGVLKKGELVTVYPPCKAGKVRGIEIFNEQADMAVAGQRTALNLTGMEKEDLSRGMIISRANTFTPSYMVDVVVHLLPSAPKALKNRSAIRFHHGSAELIGRIYLLAEEELRPGDSCLAQLRLQSPTVCCPKDHFILRRYSPMTTIGGGVVLDSNPHKHHKKDLAKVLPELKKLWSTLKEKGRDMDSALAEYFVKLYGHRGVSLADLVARTGLLEDHLVDLLQKLDSVILISQEPVLAVYKPDLEELKGQIVDFLGHFHSNHPLTTGLSREELRERFFGKAKNSHFQFVLKQLKEEKKIQISSSVVSLYQHQVALSSQQETVKKDILQLLRERGLQPPTLDELVTKLPYDAGYIRDLYYFLLQEGELVRVSEDVIIAADQIVSLKAQLKHSFPSGHTFTVPEFKDLFKISRKYAIPFLEYLDRERVTRRTGDKRVVL
ncbi:selenocysteine-specific translation elongation factor [Acidobacteria bacterium AH-259-D05]|nr:selenocysteine-specific translation elongation factor [Acidobacteria bacterium AH-259-D05]